MNNFEKELMQAVCLNDLTKAKKIVKMMLQNDKTQKNRLFVNRWLGILSSGSCNLIELPSDIKNLLVVEDVSNSFIETRYYLSCREKELLKKILKLNIASIKMAELGINYVNSSLLYGESGTGKTTFGRYLAYKMQVPFAYVNFSNVIDSHLGGTQRNLSKVFNYVKNQKCVFMLDEIDAIGTERGLKNTDVGEMSRIVISLMQNLDTLSSDVVLLAATNRKDIIDKALLRRFTNSHEIRRLSEEERLEMAKIFLDDVGYSYGEEWLSRLVEKDTTQAGLMNELILTLVNYYSEGAVNV